MVVLLETKYNSFVHNEDYAEYIVHGRLFLFVEGGGEDIHVTVRDKYCLNDLIDDSYL